MVYGILYKVEILMYNNIRKMPTSYDPIHGYIDITEFTSIIDTPEFQRLRNIKQLGACNFVFPSALGTRFEHSIGVYYLTDRMLNAIYKNSTHILPIDNHAHLIRLAALIHDIGHGPFSHLWDDLCKKNGNHEEHEYRGIEIFKYMNKKYDLQYSYDEIEFINNLINPDISELQHKNPHFWMYQIVANKESGLDTDKMDYLIRDCAVVGLDINKEDIYRVIDSAKIVDNVITFPNKPFYSRTIFNLFETRFKLHKALYQHPTVRGIELQIMDALNANSAELNGMLMPGEFPKYIESFCSLDDSIIEKIQYSKKPGHQLITALKKRKMYTLVGTFKHEEDTSNMMIGGIIDHVQMSYNSAGTNPMEKVLFYSDEDRTSSADPNTYIEPKSYCLKFVRLFKNLE
jgi:HD superfamily phosphohydrolase